MGYFKRGAFQLADDLQLAVVPVTIDGSFEILPRTGKWIHRHSLTLTIHEPIPPKCKGPENVKATMTEAYAAVESALPEKYKGMVQTTIRTDSLLIEANTKISYHFNTVLYNLITQCFIRVSCSASSAPHTVLRQRVIKHCIKVRGHNRLRRHRYTERE